MDAGKHLYFIELSHEAVGEVLELFGVFFGPPVAHVTFLVEIAALIVETVGKLMAYHHSDTTVVFSIARSGVIERSLKDSGGEHDLVVDGAVISVDSLGSHRPFGAVDRFAPFLQIAVECPFACILHIFIVRERGIHVEETVVPPFVGIADLYGDGVEFLHGGNLGVIAHPGKTDDVLAKCVAEVLHKSFHVDFAAFGEIFLYIEAADAFSHDAVDIGECFLPAGTLLLHAAHHFVEFEGCVRERIA